MKNVYRQVPIVLTEQSGFEQSQCPTSRGKMTHSGISGLSSQTGLGGNMKKMNKILLRQPQLEGKRFSQEDLLQLLRGENVMNLGSQQQWGQQNKQPFWSKVIPMGGNIRPEQVKVNLNPQYRVLTIKAYPRGSRMGLTSSMNQKILHIVTLPKNIQLDQVQVRLTQRGDLLVLAPYKFPQGQMGSKHYQSMENLQNTYLFQQGGSLGMNLPIKRNVGSRNIFRSKSPFRGEVSTSTSTSESETDSTTTSTSGSDTTTTSCTSTSESENEFQGSNLRKKKMYRKSIRGEQGLTGQTSSNITTKVQKFVRLLQKIFYPNVVECKWKQQTTNSNQPCLVLNVIPSTSQIHKNYRVHCDVQSNILIVESDITHKDLLTGSCGVKYVRREIRLPRWLNVQKMLYKVKEQGVLKIQLPCFTRTSNLMSSLCFNPFSSSSSTPFYGTKSSRTGSGTTGYGKKWQTQKYMNQQCPRCQW